MMTGTIVTFTVIEGRILYEVPEKVHAALQLIAEMQKKQRPGSVTLHVDPQGNVAKLEQKTFY